MTNYRKFMVGHKIPECSKARNILQKLRKRIRQNDTIMQKGIKTKNQYQRHKNKLKNNLLPKKPKMS